MPLFAAVPRLDRLLLLLVVVAFAAPAVRAQKNLCLMQYLVADNDLEVAITNDLLELMQSEFIASPNVQTWVYYDAHGDMHDYNEDGINEAPLSPDNGPIFLKYYHEEQDLVPVAAFGEANSDTPEALCFFLRTALADCVEGGAEEYVLTLSSHGGGHIGFGGDVNWARRRLYQSNPSIVLGIQCALDKVDGAPAKLDMIGFDACLMSSYLAIREYAPLAHFYLASETTVPGHGWYWTLPSSASTSAYAMGMTLQYLYLSESQNELNPEEHRTPKTLAMISTAGFSSFRTHFERLAEELSKVLSAGADQDFFAALQRTLSGVMAFEAASDQPGTSHPSAVDVGSFLAGFQDTCSPNLKSNLGKAIGNAIAAYDRIFLARGVGEGTKPATGMSVYFPSKKDWNIDAVHTVDYSDKSNAWVQFLLTYLTSSTPSETERKSICTRSFKSAVEQTFEGQLLLNPTLVANGTVLVHSDITANTDSVKTIYGFTGSRIKSDVRRRVMETGRAYLNSFQTPRYYTSQRRLQERNRIRQHKAREKPQQEEEKERGIEEDPSLIMFNGALAPNYHGPTYYCVWNKVVYLASRVQTGGEVFVHATTLYVTALSRQEAGSGKTRMADMTINVLYYPPYRDINSDALPFASLLADALALGEAYLGTVHFTIEEITGTITSPISLYKSAVPGEDAGSMYEVPRSEGGRIVPIVYAETGFGDSIVSLELTGDIHDWDDNFGIVPVDAATYSGFTSRDLIVFDVYAWNLDLDATELGGSERKRFTLGLESGVVELESGTDSGIATMGDGGDPAESDTSSPSVMPSVAEENISNESEAPPPGPIKTSSSPVQSPAGIPTEDGFVFFSKKSCRNSNGDVGSEKTGEFYKYSEMSRKDCQDLCSSISKCFGYEHSSRGRCEVWIVPIDKLGNALSLDCYIRIKGGDLNAEMPTHQPTTVGAGPNTESEGLPPSPTETTLSPTNSPLGAMSDAPPSSPMQSPADTPTKDGYELFSKKSCRNSNGDAGSEKTGEFWKYSEMSRKDCQHLCSSVSECFGYEHSFLGRCEVWIVPIDKSMLRNALSLDCYIRIKGGDLNAEMPTHQPTTSGASPNTDSEVLPSSPTETNLGPMNSPLGAMSDAPPSIPMQSSAETPTKDGFELFSKKSCRNSNGDAGSEKTGEFWKYSEMSREDCQNQCLFASECFGYEHSSRGRCEVWIVPIDKSMLKNALSLDCYVRNTGGDLGVEMPTRQPTTSGASPNTDSEVLPPSPTETTSSPTKSPLGAMSDAPLSIPMQSPADTPTKNGFELFSKKSCRNSNGDAGSEKTGEFWKYSEMSREDCQNQCLFISECFGYEHSSRGRCEVWIVPIDKSMLKNALSLDCYVRNTGGDLGVEMPTRQPTTSGASPNTDSEVLPPSPTETTSSPTKSPLGAMSDAPSSTPMQSPADTPTKDGFELFSKKSCRNSNGDVGSEKTGEFYEYSEMSREDCQNQCLFISECFGYEHSSRGRCEVWIVPIDKSMLGNALSLLGNALSLDCYVRNTGGDLNVEMLTRQPTTAGASPNTESEDMPPRPLETTSSPTKSPSGAMSDAPLSRPMQSPADTHMDAGGGLNTEMRTHQPTTAGASPNTGIIYSPPSPMETTPSATNSGVDAMSDAPSSSPMQPPADTPTKDCFEFFSNKSCRTSNGDKGSEKTGEFYRYAKMSREDCQNRCLFISECFGYEHSSRGRCEVWIVPINKSMLGDASSLDCYVRDTGGGFNAEMQTRQPTTADGVSASTDSIDSPPSPTETTSSPTNFRSGALSDALSSSPMQSPADTHMDSGGGLNNEMPTHQPTKAGAGPSTENADLPLIPMETTSSPTNAPSGALSDPPSSSPVQFLAGFLMKEPIQHENKASSLSPTKSPPRPNALNFVIWFKPPSSNPTQYPTTKKLTKAPLLSPMNSPDSVLPHPPSSSPVEIPTEMLGEEPTKSSSISPMNSPSRFSSHTPSSSPTQLPKSTVVNDPSLGPTGSPAPIPFRDLSSSPMQSPTDLPSKELMADETQFLNYLFGDLLENTPKSLSPTSPPTHQTTTAGAGPNTESKDSPTNSRLDGTSDAPSSIPIESQANTYTDVGGGLNTETLTHQTTTAGVGPNTESKDSPTNSRLGGTSDAPSSIQIQSPAEKHMDVGGGLNTETPTHQTTTAGVGPDTESKDSSPSPMETTSNPTNFHTGAIPDTPSSSPMQSPTDRFTEGPLLNNATKALVLSPIPTYSPSDTWPDTPSPSLVQFPTDMPMKSPPIAKNDISVNPDEKNSSERSAVPVVILLSVPLFHLMQL